MKTNCITFLVLTLLFLFKQSNAQTISQLSFYSPLISTFDMKYTNNHLVVAQNGLLIFDVTNPQAKPQLVAQATYPGSYAYVLAVQGNYAYMAEGGNGIFGVYDISNFGAPVLKGSFAIPSTAFYIYGDIAVQNNYAYLTGFDSLFIVDVSNADAPALAKAIEVDHNDFRGAEDVAIDHQTLFVKTPSGIQVYNIADPVSPVLKSSIPFTHIYYNNGLAVDTVNHRLFQPWLTTLQEFLGYDAYDVSTPAAPQFLFRDSVEFGSGDFGTPAYSYTDTTLFISKGGGINAFNVSTDQHRFVTSFAGEDIPNASVSIQVRDSVFFHARGGGIEVLKYSNSPVPVCIEPDSLRQKVLGTNALLYWNKKPGARTYVFRYRIIGTNDWKYVPSKDNFGKLENLMPGKAYTWEVRAVCGPSLKETSDWSLYNVFYVGNPGLISISPNPVQDMMHVKVSDPSITQILITDLTGKTFYRSKIPGKDSKISAASLKTGTYIVHGLDKNNTIISTIKIFRQ